MLGGGEAAVPALLYDPRPEVRAQAVEWAAFHPAPVVIERLIELLGDPEALCRFSAKDSLMRIGRPVAPRLAAHLAARPRGGLHAALEVAAGLAQPIFLAPALALCDDADPRTRELAARLVGAVGGSQASETLTALLADPAPTVRATAAQALGRLGERRSAPALARSLGDEDPEVRLEAALALRGVGGPGIVSLRRALRDGDGVARDMARHVLDLPAPAPEPIGA